MQTEKRDNHQGTLKVEKSKNIKANSVQKQLLIGRLLDKKFGKAGQPVKDDCDSCGERCFD